MESEKVKEIKEKLQEEIFIANSFGDKLRKVPTKELENLLTLINELESENKELKKYRLDWLNSEKMHLQADLEDAEFELNSANRSLQELREENRQLKDRIAELEKEDARLLDSVETVQNNRCVYKCELTKKQLKQFAERLKEQLGSVDLIRGWTVKVFIDEALKEFINNKGDDIK